MWRRKGLFYYNRWSIAKPSSEGYKITGHIIKRLDFISYHFLRLIYGEESLRNVWKHNYLSKNITHDLIEDGESNGRNNT